jgi:Glycosyl transferase family 2
MPVLNGGAFLRTAIDSILAQTAPDLELLIVDDGSTDDSAALAEGIRDSRIVVIRNERTRGLPAALNIGLRRASGEFVARLDQDDVARPDRIERQVAVLRRDARLALIGSQARLIDQTGAAVGSVQRCLDEVTVRWYCLFDNPFIHSSVMFRRREVVDELGGYDESLHYAEDWDLWSRVMRRYAVRNLPDRLVDYRTWPASMMGAIESAPGHPKRAVFQGVVRAVIARHVEWTLGSAAASADDIEQMTRFVLGVPADHVDRFLSLFARLIGLFQARYPAAAASTDFERTLARQFDAIAYRLTPPRRQAAVRVYRAAIARGPAVARRLSWSRMAVTVAFGRSGRDWLRRMRTA